MDRFEWKEEDVKVLGICHKCKNALEGDICKAFPWGIPDEFLIGAVIHDYVTEDQADEFVFEEK